jgi:hypothetical protein
LVTGDGGGGSSLEGLDEREEMLLRSFVGGVEVEAEGILGLMRKRRTPFMLIGDVCAGTVDSWAGNGVKAGKSTVSDSSHIFERSDRLVHDQKPI